MAHGMFRPQSFQCLEAALDAQRQGHRLVALRGRRRRRAARQRHPHPLLPGAEPAHRAARRVARRAPQALARGRPRVQRLRHRDRSSTRWRPTRRHGPDRVPRAAHGDDAASARSASRRWRRCRDWKAPRPAGPRARHLDQRALRLARRRRRRDLARPRERQDPRAQGVARGRRRRHRAARRGAGQRRERHRLRPVERAARARHDEGRRRASRPTSTTTT